MDNKQNKATNRKTTTQLTLENALSSSSEDEGTIGSYARQPQSLASSRKDTQKLLTNDDLYDRKMSFAKQDNWGDDDSDESDEQLKSITKQATQQV